MLDELGEHCRVGDAFRRLTLEAPHCLQRHLVVPLLVVRCVSFTAAVAAWLVLRHCDTTPRRA